MECKFRDQKLKTILGIAIDKICLFLNKAYRPFWMCHGMYENHEMQWDSEVCTIKDVSECASVKYIKQIAAHQSKLVDKLMGRQDEED